MSLDNHIKNFKWPAVASAALHLGVIAAFSGEWKAFPSSAPNPIPVEIVSEEYALYSFGKDPPLGKENLNAPPKPLGSPTGSDKGIDLDEYHQGLGEIDSSNDNPPYEIPQENEGHAANVAPPEKKAESKSARDDLNEAQRWSSLRLKSLEKTLDLLLLGLDLQEYLSEGKTAREFYFNNYPAGERNEATYSELWRVYVNTSLLKNPLTAEVCQVLVRNENVGGVLEFSSVFAADGTVTFKDVKYHSNFRDSRGIAKKFYEEFLDKLPKKFIPPEDAQLQAPVTYHYLILGNTFRCPKSIPL